MEEEHALDYSSKEWVVSRASAKYVCNELMSRHKDDHNEYLNAKDIGLLWRSVKVG